MQAIDFLNTLCIVEISYVQTYTAAQDRYPMKNPGRRHHGFLYTVSGTETYHFKDADVKAVPGSVLYIPKGEEYRITLDGPESVATAVDFEIAGDPIRPFPVQFSERNSVRLCFSKIEAEWDRKDSPYIPACKSLCYSMIEMMIKQQGLYLTSQNYKMIAAGVEYLHRHYLERDFRICDAAKASQISCRHFEKLFRRKYGTTPNEYTLLMKIERAKELLLSEKVLIREIPFMLGYADIYHFGKLFASKTGYTPSAYRKTFMTEKNP